MNKKLNATLLVFLLSTGCSDFFDQNKSIEKQKIANEKTIIEVKNIIHNTLVSDIDKIRAINRIRVFDPVQAESMQKIVMLDVDKKVAENKKNIEKMEKQQAINDQKIRIIEKKKKKQEGIRIGMSMQDVLDSSWGSPQHKTSYHSSLSTQTIWQYGDYGERGTIIFKNGIVDIIQN